MLTLAGQWSIDLRRLESALIAGSPGSHRRPPRSQRLTNQTQGYVFLPRSVADVRPACHPPPAKAVRVALIRAKSSTSSYVTVVAAARKPEGIATSGVVSTRAMAEVRRVGGEFGLPHCDTSSGRRAVLVAAVRCRVDDPSDELNQPVRLPIDGPLDRAVDVVAPTHPGPIRVLVKPSSDRVSVLSTRSGTTIVSAIPSAMAWCATSRCTAAALRAPDAPEAAWVPLLERAGP